MKGQIAVVVLASGLIAVGRVEGYDKDSGLIALQKPLRIDSHIVASAQGPQPMIVPSRLNPYSDEPMVITRTQYLQVVMAPKQLSDTWLQSTTSIDLGKG